MNQLLPLFLILLAAAPVVIGGIVHESKLYRQLQRQDARRTADAGTQPHTRQWRGAGR